MGGAAGARGGNHQKLAELIKPPVLLKDSTPVEFKSWCRRFNSYYTAARLIIVNITIQQSIFRALIDSKIEVKIAADIGDRTPIYGNVSCTQLLKQEFKDSFPLATLRAKYFSKKQQAGQKN